jgi:alkylhydroperoxidase family enzyme
LQGGDEAVVEAIWRRDIENAAIPEAERVLLRFVELITRHAYRNTPEEVEKLRAAGWTDPQIAEAVYITALFAFFNRVADAFGLEDPGYFNGEAAPGSQEKKGPG